MDHSGVSFTLDGWALGRTYDLSFHEAFWNIGWISEAFVPSSWPLGFDMSWKPLQLLAFCC